MGLEKKVGNSLFSSPRSIFGQICSVVKNEKWNFSHNFCKIIFDIRFLIWRASFWPTIWLLSKMFKISILFDLISDLMTFNDLFSHFFEILAFWTSIWPINWPFLTIIEIWPRKTSNSLNHLTYFSNYWNFVNKAVSGNLVKIFSFSEK